MNTENHVKSIVKTALMSAFCLIFTIFFPVTLPTGYANLGDAVCFLSGFMLNGFYGSLAAGLGSGLADLIGGYGVYFPATFVAKAAIALLGALAKRAVLSYKYENKKILLFLYTAICSLIGEGLMIATYFLYESFILGLGEAALASILGNATQATVGLILSLVLTAVFTKSKKLRKLL